MDRSIRWISNEGSDEKGINLNRNSLAPSWCSFNKDRFIIFKVMKTDGTVKSVELDTFEIEQLKRAIDQFYLNLGP